MPMLMMGCVVGAREVSSALSRSIGARYNSQLSALLVGADSLGSGVADAAAVDRSLMITFGT